MRCNFVMAVCFGLLGGCATIPEDQCAKVDWYDLGVTDGRAGQVADRLLRHREACAGVQVVPDEQRYLQGRQEGLAEYCRPDNAQRGRVWRAVRTRTSVMQRSSASTRPPTRSPR